MECKKCSSKNYHKSGFVNGNQRYRCKDCGCQFVPLAKNLFSEKVKLTACLLYLNGLSYRTIGKLLGTSVTSVYKWIKKFAIENYEKPAPTNDEVIIELDEMWH